MTDYRPLRDDERQAYESTLPFNEQQLRYYRYVRDVKKRDLEGNLDIQIEEMRRQFELQIQGMRKQAEYDLKNAEQQIFELELAVKDTKEKLEKGVPVKEETKSSCCEDTCNCAPEDVLTIEVTADDYVPIDTHCKHGMPRGLGLDCSECKKEQEE